MTVQLDTVIAEMPKLAVRQLGEMYACQSMTPIEVVQIYFDRIDRLNPQLNAYVTVDIEGAYSAAEASTKRWDTSTPLSPYDGVPIALKANFAVQDWPWHAGIEAYKDRIAANNAVVVDRLLDAGFIILGLTNMDEGALGASGDNGWLGRCFSPLNFKHSIKYNLKNNDWSNRNLSPGGSSGGSAVAVAASLCAAAIGTDTMGSVRIPGAYCGISSHKPSFGKIPTHGIVPLSTTYDSVGLLAQNSSDIEAILSVISSSVTSRSQADSASCSQLRIACLDYSTDVHCTSEIDALFEKVIKQITNNFGDVKTIAWPAIDISRLRRKLLLIAEIEAQQTHAHMLLTSADKFSSHFKSMLKFGERKSQELMQTNEALEKAANQIRCELDAFDIILTPATPGPAFSFDSSVPENQADFSVLANVAGLPATVVNIGSTEDGLPVGVQIMSKQGEDENSLCVGRAVEDMFA